MAVLYFWRKNVTPGRLDHWLGRIGEKVDAGRLAVLTRPGGSQVQVEAYLDSARETAALQELFGGRCGQVIEEDWLAASSIAAGKTLAFGRRLLITGSPDALPGLRAASPARQVLCIPAAMAFGTGEHATTAMCLRLLSEVPRVLRPGAPWQVLDLGSGSGVLALAARGFGASRAVGVDNDPHAVRTARENAGLNQVARVRFSRVDLLRDPWPGLPDSALARVLTANLFSELHIALMPRMAAVLGSGDLLIASGVLASQTPEVETAFQDAGLTVATRRRRGRWVAYLARR